MKKFETKELTLIAVFAAIWIGYAFMSSTMIGQLAKGIDVHVVRSLLLILVVAMMGRFGGATWLTTIVGIYYLSSRTPYPPIIISIATIASGLVYDVYARVIGYENAANWKVFSIGILLAGLTQSVITLGTLTFMGFFPQRILRTVWITGLTKNVAASIGATIIAAAIVRRVVAVYKNYG